MSLTKIVNGLPVVCSNEESAAIQAEWDANALIISRGKTPAAKNIAWEGNPSLVYSIIATNLTLVTGHWLATWTGGHDGGMITAALTKGNSITLTGSTNNSLVLTIDINGNLLLQRTTGFRDYRVSLNLYGR